MRIEEGSLLERLNQKRERRLSIIAAFRIFSLFTGCLQTCDYHLLDVLICWSYQATPACIGLKPLKIHYYVLCIVHCAWLRPQGLASSWLSAGQGLLCLLQFTKPSVCIPPPPQPCQQLMPINTKICQYIATLIPLSVYSPLTQSHRHDNHVKSCSDTKAVFTPASIFLTVSKRSRTPSSLTVLNIHRHD